MQLKAICSGAALYMALAGNAFSAQALSADQWLQRVQSAQDAQGYQGAFVYERKGAFSTHQVWRQVNAQGQLLERFLQLNGPAHEVMRIDGNVTCMSAALADELTVVDIWPAQAFKLQDLQQSYDLRALGETRVAGHMTSVLLFSPRDQHRYPVEIYVDQFTAVPLKTLLLNEHGQLLERLQFVQFQAESDHAQLVTEQTVLAPSADCLPVTEVKPVSVETEHDDLNWTVSWIPPGFKLLKSNYQAVASDSYALSQVYSDGLANFSIFFESIDGLEVEAGRLQLGPTAVVSRKVTDDSETLIVTVVGEIPMGSAERIALSVHAQQEQLND